jgi:hypothetical protein
VDFEDELRIVSGDDDELLDREQGTPHFKGYPRSPRSDQPTPGHVSAHSPRLTKPLPKDDSGLPRQPRCD